MTAHRGHATQRKPDVNRRLWVTNSNGSLPSVGNAPCWYRTLRVEEAVTGWGRRHMETLYLMLNSPMSLETALKMSILKLCTVAYAACVVIFF